MLNKLKTLRASREEGFSLVELLVVILIIGILTALALPIFMNQQEAAMKATVKEDARTILAAVNTMLVKNPKATDSTGYTGPTPVTPADVAALKQNYPFYAITQGGQIQFSKDNYSVIVGQVSWDMSKNPKRLTAYLMNPSYDQYTILVFNDNIKHGWGVAYDSRTGKFSEFDQF